MAETLIVKPLGLVLQKAGLISLEQVKIALKAKKTLPHYRIGEILAIRGWIKPETANFFAEQWPHLLVAQKLEPLGQYLKAAGFISDRQINQILQEQTTTHLKFGDYAVLQGLISQTTLNFFLQQLDLIREKTITKATLDDHKIFNTIESHILHNHRCEPSDLLKLYQRIRHEGEIQSNNDPLEGELVKSSLIIKQGNKLKVANSKYKSVFDQDWIEEELLSLQPYTKIRLRMFGLEKVASLPHRVLNAVNHWANNQPFLTQKIYQIVREQQVVIAHGEETATIDNLVQEHLIHNWETGAAAAHFQDIQEQLLDNKEFSTASLLKTYQHLWQQGKIEYDGTPQKKKLLELGLAKLENGILTLSNPIYHAVFDRVWVEKQLETLGVDSKLNSQLETNPVTTKLSPKSHLNHVSLYQRFLFPVLSIVAILFSGAALYWLGQEYLQANNQKQLLDSGDQELKSKNYSEALAFYNKALRVDQNIASIWINRGYALEGLEEYELMLQSCISATVIQPQSESALKCRGKALFHLKEYEETVKAWEKAIAINPEDPLAWISYGEALHKTEQYQASISAINRAIHLLKNNPQADSSSLPIAYNGQGKSLLKQHEYSYALEAFNKSLIYAPNYLAAQQGKALALTKLGKNQEASKIFAQLLIREDLSSEQQAITWLYQGINFCLMKQPPLAKAAFKKAQQLDTKYDKAITTAQRDCQQPD